MEIDYSPYSYETVIDTGTLYIFKTDFELLYEVSFKPTPYLFSSDKPYADDAYEFSIIVIENPNHASPPFDNRIGSTIAKIFDSFMKNLETRLAYIFVRLITTGRWFVFVNSMDGFQPLELQNM